MNTQLNNDAISDQTAEPNEVQELEKGLGVKPEPKQENLDDSGANGENDLGDEDDARTHVDEELTGAANEDEREAIRERRRQEKARKRVRDRDKRDSLQRQVDTLVAQNQELSQKMAGIQNANAGAQINQIDQAIVQANRAREHFKELVADATTRGDGRAAAEATEAMIEARSRSEQLVNYKNNLTNRATAKPPLNPEMVRHAQEFLSTKAKWYGGPQSADPDSKVFSAIDNSLAAEGWDPTTREYWDELEARGSKYLPHRFSTGADGKPGYSGSNAPKTGSKSGPVAGGSGDGGSNKGGVSTNTVLSAERVKAIKEAGAWDDPKRRNDMIKRFKDYDQSQKL